MNLMGIDVLRAVLAVFIASHSFAAEVTITDREFADALAPAARKVSRPAFQWAPKNPMRDLPFYAREVLRGSTNTSMKLVGMSADGSRAVLMRYGSLLATVNSASMLVRTGRVWRELSLLRRMDWEWIGGVNFDALAFSADGKRLLYQWFANAKDYNSRTIRVLDVDTGGEHVLVKNWERFPEKPVAQLVADSDWLRQTYPGKTVEEVFPSPRCEQTGALKAEIEIPAASYQPGEPSLALTGGRDGAGFDLGWLLGPAEYQYQGGRTKAYSQDCSRGLIAVEEVVESTSFSFWYGSDAHNARIRLVEFGLRRGT